MREVPVGTSFADLAKLLERHPAPWRFDNHDTNPGVFDRAGGEVHVGFIFSEEDDEVAAGLVAAVNLAAGLSP